MTEAIEDVSSLPGKKVTDQEENPIGEIKQIYAVDGDGEPAWIRVEASFGIGDKRNVVIPLARLKDEAGELRVPYSYNHVKDTPELENEDEITAEEERKLRDHYGIDRADQELRTDNDSYATRVPEGTPGAKIAEDPDQLETPDADKTDEETQERLHEVGSSEINQVDAGKIADESTSRSSKGDSDSEQKSSEESDSKESSESGDSQSHSGHGSSPEAKQQD